MNISRATKLLLAIFGVIILLMTVIWFFFFRASTSIQTTPITSFGTPTNNSTGASTNTSGSNTTQPIASSGQISQQKIFEIDAGPIVSATLIQTLNPTTTLARYINQDDGHVYDLPLDVPGALPRVVSDTTIPGGYRALWLKQGSAAILQYIEGGVVKTLYMGFPAASSTVGTQPTKIQFLPDAIEDIAVSPDGQSIVYLLTTSNGADGYIASASAGGVGGKKIFSLPLSQVLISWPSQGTLMAQTKSAAEVPGIIFSIDAKSGIITPLIYAQGVTATANSSFSMLLYQISNGIAFTSYLHDVKSGLEALLPINPLPEQCVWGSISTIFCAAPIQATPANYFDLWHQGLASVADNIFEINTNLAGETVVASPGTSDGGIASDILEMSLSPDQHYLSFMTKGDRSLWGVRLTQ